MLKVIISIFIFFSVIVVSYAAIDFGWDNVSDDLKSSDKDISLVVVIQNIVEYLIWLLYLIAIIFGLYSWVIILTASWEEERVKKWKSIMINVVLGLIVIFLSSVIINWVIDVMTSDEIINSEDIEG